MEDIWYSIDVENRSDHPIDFYVKPFGYPNVDLPDTIYHTLERVQPGERKYDYLFPDGLSDYEQVTRISVYIFHSDTIDKYSWREVVEGNKILERYDLNVAAEVDDKELSIIIYEGK